MAADNDARLQISLIGVFAFLLLGIGAANYLFYHAESTASRERAQAELVAIADLKAREIDNWRRERLGDAATVRDNTALAPLFARWLNARPGGEDAADARRWLQLYVSNFDYQDAALIDRRGRVIAATKAGLPFPDASREQREQALKSGNAVLSDLWALPDGSQGLDLLTPLPAPPGRESPGLLLLRVAPGKVLYPMLQHWPTPTVSAEILLVQQRGTRIVYLNELRHQAGAALSLSLDAGLTTLPAVYAARGDTRAMEGIDYRGLVVYAATQPVPGTDWGLVAKIDESEVLKPLHERIGLMIFVSTLLIIVAGGVTLVLWQAQRDLVRQQRQRDAAARDQLQRVTDRLTESQKIGRIGSWERDLASNRLWWSEESYRLFDITPDLMPEPDYDFFVKRIHPDDRVGMRLLVQSAVASGEPYAIDYRVCLPNGDERIFQNTGQVVRDDQGTPIRTAGTVQDVTELRRQEHELRERGEQLRTIIENIPGGVSLMDGNLDFVAFNAEFGRLLDFPHELVGRTPLPMMELALFNARRGDYGPGDPQMLAEQVVARARTPVAHHFERARPDGTIIEVHGAPLPGGGFVTIYTDVTERRRNEESLVLAKKVFDNSPEAIMITDEKNRIVSVNEAFTQITGYAPDEVIGQDPRMLASGRHDTSFYRQMWDALQRNGHWAGEIIDRRKSGDVYPKWMSINAVMEFPAGRVTHYIAMFTDITERKRAEERIHFLAHHDALTELPNRLSLELRLEQALIDARRHDWNVGVLFIDLDRFKVINDTLGHNIGDKLLIEVARRFTVAVRESDMVARLGGDEFVIVLPDLENPDAAAHVALKIVSALLTPIRIDSHELHTSPSIGISIYPMDGRSVDAILKNADTAMYHAKALGRNNYQFFAEEMNRIANERLSLEGRLRQALARQELSLHYQPQMAADGSCVIGVEALLRWEAPNEGMIAPDRFIAIAEETGLIVPIGEWVLKEACRQLRTWLDAGVPPLRMAVNLSARQLGNAELLTTVSEALAESGIPPQLLELEITESAIMEKPEEAIKVLQALKQRGIKLAVDDFGTGYSSLAYLKLFPIDHLKIDRSFVRDIERDPDDAAIAISTIALAHSLGLKVVAEGVETRDQLMLLQRNGCDEVQGFLFSRPLPAPAALAFLKRGREDRLRQLH